MEEEKRETLNKYAGWRMMSPPEKGLIKEPQCVAGLLKGALEAVTNDHSHNKKEMDRDLR